MYPADHSLRDTFFTEKVSAEDEVSKHSSQHLWFIWE